MFTSNKQAVVTVAPMPTAIEVPASEMVRLANKPPWYRSLFVQLLVAIVAGVVIGWLWPGLGADLRPWPTVSSS